MANDVRQISDQSWLSHLGELRIRLLKSLVVVAVLFFIALNYTNPMILWLKVPLVKALPPGGNSLYFTGPMDVLFLNLKVAGLAGILGAAPYWIWQIWAFVSPGLYAKERRLVTPFLLSSIALFFFGIAFCYYVVLPFALQYLIGLGVGVGTPIITISEYMGLVLLLMLGFGIVFETPVILILLAFAGVIDADMLSGKRRHAIVAILIVAAVLTPTPDPFNQMLMATPMYLMYEISIILIRFLTRKRESVTND